MSRSIIGVLALQGCVTPHRPHIEALGLGYREVRGCSDLDGIRGLILPGGESTTMLKLLAGLDLEQALRDALRRVPAWGICAGAILLAGRVRSPEQRSLGVLDIEIERNSYGRQLDSFESEVEGYPVVFIRAPRIRSIGPGIHVRSSCGEDPIWVEGKAAMATTFHPELSRVHPSPMHRRFSELCLS